MANIEFTATEKTWYITQPSNHHGVLENGENLASGQDSIEYFDTEAEWLAALDSLGISIGEEEEIVEG